MYVLSVCFCIVSIVWVDSWPWVGTSRLSRFRFPNTSAALNVLVSVYAVSLERKMRCWFFSFSIVHFSARIVANSLPHDEIVRSCSKVFHWKIVDLAPVSSVSTRFTRPSSFFLKQANKKGGRVRQAIMYSVPVVSAGRDGKRVDLCGAVSNPHLIASIAILNLWLFVFGLWDFRRQEQRELVIWTKVYTQKHIILVEVVLSITCRMCAWSSPSTCRVLRVAPFSKRQFLLKKDFPTHSECPYLMIAWLL